MEMRLFHCVSFDETTSWTVLSIVYLVLLFFGYALIIFEFLLSGKAIWVDHNGETDNETMRRTNHGGHGPNLVSVE